MGYSYSLTEFQREYQWGPNYFFARQTSFVGFWVDLLSIEPIREECGGHRRGNKKMSFAKIAEELNLPGKDTDRRFAERCARQLHQEAEQRIDNHIASVHKHM
jgi:hypothetical protein